MFDQEYIIEQTGTERIVFEKLEGSVKKSSLSKAQVVTTVQEKDKGIIYWSQHGPKNYSIQLELAEFAEKMFAQDLGLYKLQINVAK